MDYYPAGWEEGFKDGVESQQARLMDLERRVKEFEANMVVPKSEYALMANQVSRLKKSISRQARCIVSLVKERDTLIAEKEKQ